MLTKEFFADSLQRYGVGTIKNLHDLVFKYVGSGNKGVGNKQLDSDMMVNSAYPSSVTCGFGELGNVYNFKDFGGEEGRILTGLWRFLVMRRTMIVYHSPARGNFDCVAGLLRRYGFEEKQRFYNPNSGNTVVQLQNELGYFGQYLSDEEINGSNTPAEQRV